MSPKSIYRIVTALLLLFTLGHTLGRPTIVPVPETAIHVMFGEMGDATILASQRVVPTRLLGAGFTFRYETLAAALPAVLAG